jgi:hypothetical protein
MPPNTRLQATVLRAALAVLGLTRFGRRLNRHVGRLPLVRNFKDVRILACQETLIGSGGKYVSAGNDARQGV